MSMFPADIQRWLDEDLAVLACVETECDEAAQLRWLKNAYRSHADIKAHLRSRFRVFRNAVLSWPEVQGRTLTVADAQMLGVCRVCRKPQAGPFVYDFGEEYACVECVNGEAAEKEKGGGI